MLVLLSNEQFDNNIKKMAVKKIFTNLNIH
jgi:hypothetical protein